MDFGLSQYHVKLYTDTAFLLTRFNFLMACIKHWMKNSPVIFVFMGITYSVNLVVQFPLNLCPQLSSEEQILTGNCQNDSETRERGLGRLNPKHILVAHDPGPLQKLVPLALVVSEISHHTRCVPVFFYFSVLNITKKQIVVCFTELFQTLRKTF